MAHIMHALSHLAMADASPTLWYLTRALAIAAYVTLALSVILGMLRTIARRSGEQLTWIVDDLHAFVASIAGILVLGHMVTLYLDPFLPFPLKNLLIPQPDQPYRTLAVNLGIFAFYAMLALLLSSWARRRLAYRVWRVVHALSFVAVILVTIHGLLAGSDSDEPWMHALYGGTSAALIFLTLYRLVVQPRRAPSMETPPELFAE